MQSMIVNNNQARNPVLQQTTHSQHPVSAVMNSDFSKEHPSYPDTTMFHQQNHGMPRQIIASCQNITGYPSNKHHGHFFSSAFNLSTPLNVHVLQKEIRSEL